MPLDHELTRCFIHVFTLEFKKKQLSTILDCTTVLHYRIDQQMQNLMLNLMVFTFSQLAYQRETYTAFLKGVHPSLL